MQNWLHRVWGGFYSKDRKRKSLIKLQFQGENHASSNSYLNMRYGTYLCYNSVARFSSIQKVNEHTKRR